MLGTSQAKRKRCFDRKSVSCEFKVGDKVLVLLPVLGSALSLKFLGLYVIKERLSKNESLSTN